jgi:cyanophycin synthetase
MSDAGKSVGLATWEGLFIDGMQLHGVEPRNPDGPRTLLNNPATEVAVVEVDPLDVIHDGLGFDMCDVAVVSSRYTGPATGLRTPEAVLLETVDAQGVVVLNADNPHVLALLPEIDRPVMLYCRDAQSSLVQSLVREGHRVVALNGKGHAGEVVVIDPATSPHVLRPGEGFLSGNVDDVEGVLAAVATSLAFGMPRHQVERTLMNIGK